MLEQLAGDAARANEINSPRDALAMVTKMAGWGATSIKQYAQPRRDQRQWTAEAARTVGTNLTSEGGFFFEDLGFIMDGQTGWEHSFSEVSMYAAGAKFFGKAGATIFASDNARKRLTGEVKSESRGAPAVPAALAAVMVSTAGFTASSSP